METDFAGAILSLKQRTAAVNLEFLAYLLEKAGTKTARREEKGTRVGLTPDS
jgi:hypothetical protein